MERLACLIVAHNLGDAVIQSNFLTSLIERKYAINYLVWTRPQVAFLFADMPNCEVICSQFPVGTNKQFGGLAFFTFMKAARAVRSRRPSVTIDLIGDLRDRLFAKLAGSRNHAYIGWAEDHPFRRLIRNPFGIGKPTIIVSSDTTNVYDAHRLMLNHLIRPRGESKHETTNDWLISRNMKPIRIGLHPFASQHCKLWTDEHWRELVEILLRDAKVKIVAFGAPNEHRRLSHLFEPFAGRIELVNTTLSDFASQTADLDVMVGLDSFSVHMAHRQGIRSVLINAGNPTGMWAPPSSTVLAKSGSCVHYPCFNIQRCEGTQYENACVNATTAMDVAEAIRQ